MVFFPESSYSQIRGVRQRCRCGCRGIYFTLAGGELFLFDRWLLFELVGVPVELVGRFCPAQLMAFLNLRPLSTDAYASRLLYLV
jgi:hypothetical protein